MPHLQLHLIPGLACAAHCGLAPKTVPTSIDDYVAAGRAMQHFWLEATRLGLWVQPEMIPVLFARYCRERIASTSSVQSHALATVVAARYYALLGDEWAPWVIFFARAGTSRAPRARSTRIPLSELVWNELNSNINQPLTAMQRRHPVQL